MNRGAADRRWAIVLLGVVLVVATALRVVGLTYGLPAVYNPDEVAIMNRAMGFAKGDLNPHNFVYPTLYFYVLFAWEGLAFLGGRAVGVFDSVAAFERSFFVDPTFIYAAGRLLTLLCGVLTVAATYVLATRLMDRTAGVTSALLLAVAPLAVRDAHYVKHDVPVTLLIVLMHVVLARGAMRARDWVAAGALAGLAMSTHYYAVFLVVPLAAAALATPPAESSTVYGLRAAPLAAAAAAVALLATSPFLLADLDVTLRDITANRQIVVDRVTQTQGVLGSGAFYLRWLVREASGAGGFLLSLGGLFILPRLGWRRALLVVSFPAAFLLFIANTYPASRYLNAVLPFVAVLGGLAVSSMARHGGARRTAAAALIALAALEAGASSLRTDLFFRQRDTRSLALDWIEQHVPSGSSVLVEPYSVPLRMSRDALQEALTVHLGAVDRASIKFQRMLALDPYPTPAYRAIYLGTGGLDVDRIYVPPAAFEAAGSLAPLRRLSVTHVIRRRYNGPEPAHASFDAALEREGRRVAVFTPYAARVGPEERGMAAPFLHNTDASIDRRLERPGPTIEIWIIPE